MPETFCENCPYRRCDDYPLSMERNSTRALLILQAPGQEEWREKQPAISESRTSAAARIADSFDRIGKVREDFSITNAVQCYPGRPPGGDRDDPPCEQAVEACAGRLQGDIESEDWLAVVVFGNTAKEIVRCLGYGEDPRFRFIKHPSGGLSNECLDDTLRWAASQ